MAKFTAICSNGYKFNLKAQTLNQALKKVSDQPFYTSGAATVYTYNHPHLETLGVDCETLPFLTFTIGLYGKYGINPNTNKKAINALAKQVH